MGSILCRTRAKTLLTTAMFLSLISHWNTPVRTNPTLPILVRYRHKYRHFTMTPQTLFLSILASSITLTATANPLALASIEMTTHYAFDSNVVAVIAAVDDKSAVTADDPLNNIVFTVSFNDKIDGSLITDMTGDVFPSSHLRHIYSHPTVENVAQSVIICYTDK